MSGGARWLPWLRLPDLQAPDLDACRVWVPVADVLDIMRELGAPALREALGAVLDEAAPLVERRDDD